MIDKKSNTSCKSKLELINLIDVKNVIKFFVLVAFIVKECHLYGYTNNGEK